MDKKQKQKKKENKNTTNECKYFLESNFVGVNRLFVLVCSNVDDNAKRYNLRGGIIHKKVLLRIITSLSTERTFIATN